MRPVLPLDLKPDRAFAREVGAEGIQRATVSCVCFLPAGRILLRQARERYQQQSCEIANLSVCGVGTASPGRCYAKIEKFYFGYSF